MAGLRDWDLTATLTVDQKRYQPARVPGPQREGGRNGRLQWPTRLTEDGRVTLATAPMTGEIARGRVRRWLRDGEELLGRPVSAVVALEYQHNGWPHFHSLLGIDGGLRGQEISALGRLWHERNGWADVQVPRSIGAVARYAAKYLTKDLDRGSVLIHPARGPLASLQTTFGPLREVGRRKRDG